MSYIDRKLSERIAKREEDMSLLDFLARCRTDSSCYASAAERMLKAIGEPDIVDTSKDARLSRIFLNRTIKVYPAFADFYGLEDTIERIVGFFQHAAQRLQEAKQILHLLGPVGGGKSSLAERLKALMEKEPIYVLCAEDGTPSPLYESPFGLFDQMEDGAELEKEFNIPARALAPIPSPWALKRLDGYDGDITRFKVRKLWPSRAKQIAVMRVEAGDANTQDVSTLTGRVDIRKLEDHSSHDPDAYAFSGGLNRATQGVLELVESFKMGAQVLNPLLAATADQQYAGTEAIGQIPWNGLIVSHSNSSEFQAFTTNKKNEAFVDRMTVIKVPYCLRVTEEAQIYGKLLAGSTLSSAPCAPHTLDLLARFTVMSRLKTHENSTQYAKLRVYNGDNLKDTEPRAKAITEYRDTAGVDEGMTGISTRFAFKVLASTFNYDPTEIAADPVHLFLVLRQAIRREQLGEEVESQYMSAIKEELETRYAEDVGKEIQKAYLESYTDYGQNIFDRYVAYADAWQEDVDFKDPDTGQLLDRAALNDELTKTEKPAGIANPKDFRNEVVKFALRYRANHNGENPPWTAYEKIREVIEQRMFGSLEDLLPVISFGAKQDAETEEKHQKFVDRMVSRGYTAKQVRRLTEWYMRAKKSS